jgi:hypothetical protein
LQHELPIFVNLLLAIVAVAPSLLRSLPPAEAIVRNYQP